MFATLACSLLVAGPPARLPVETGKEMTAAIIAVNKALGLESWIVPGEKPCVDRGGLEGLIKDVSAKQTRTCAATVLGPGFPGLGKDYFVGITMADIGPVTAFAVGRGQAEGWGAYSCDPKRRCRPTKLSSRSKQAKRLAERYHRACEDARTVWFPSRDGVCQGIPMPPAPAAKAPTPDQKPRPALQGQVAGQKPPGAGHPSRNAPPPAREPWPVKQ